MQIAVHMGAHCTDEDRLLKSILKNGDRLAQHGVKAPGPGKYRRLIRETIQTLNGAPADPDARQILLDAILDDEDIHRLVMSNENFICIANRIFDHGLFYQQTAFKIRGLLGLFPGDQIEFFLGLRDPATFLPAAITDTKFDTLPDFLQTMPLTDIRWSGLVRQIREVAPETRLTVWCNEDTPLIWDKLLRRICDLPDDLPLDGSYDLLATIMSPEGLNRFQNYLRKHPPKTTAQHHKIVETFLEKYALEEAIEDTIDLPELDADTVAALSQSYEADIDLIANMPDVTFIEP